MQCTAILEDWNALGWLELQRLGNFRWIIKMKTVSLPLVLSSLDEFRFLA